MIFISIKEKTVIVKLAPKNIRHYESIGYYIPRKKNVNGKPQIPLGTTIEVRVEDLTPKSNVVVTRVCDGCGKEDSVKYDSLVRYREKRGNDYCKSCGGLQRWSERKMSVPTERSLAYLFPSLADEWDYEKNSKTPFEVFFSSHDSAWWICNECNNEYEAPINRRTNMLSGCPYCNESKGEKRILKYLVDNGYMYEREYKFDSLNGIGGRPLRFDFAVLNDNKTLRLLVEYDGVFHFEQIFEGSDYEKTVKHDKMKNEYCLNNGVPLIRIHYSDFDKIEEILDDKLGGL